MEAKIVDVERGWGWIVDGWSLFMKNPVMWVLMILIYALIMILLSFIPLLGPLASGLLGTMLAGGIIYGASWLDGGGALEVSQLFQAFWDPTKTTPMLILGLISMVANLLMSVVGEGLIVRSLMGAGMMGDGSTIKVVATVFLGILLLLLVATALAVLLIYAIPLVMLEKIPPKEAVKSSLEGCQRNWLPLLVFGLIYSVLALLAAIPLGLGFLILGPVTAGAWYQSYKDLYVAYGVAWPSRNPTI